MNLPLPQTLSLTLTRTLSLNLSLTLTAAVSELLRRMPALGWSLAPVVAANVSGARDLFLCGEACAHVGVLLQQKAMMGPQLEKLVALLPALQTGLLELLRRDKLKVKQA